MNEIEKTVCEFRKLIEDGKIALWHTKDDGLEELEIAKYVTSESGNVHVYTPDAWFTLLDSEVNE